MAAGAYQRLLNWSKANSELLRVSKAREASGYEWHIALSVDVPVAFSTTGRGKTIDEAAQRAIDDLETVGVSVPA